MIRKTLVVLSLLVVTTLSGCVAYVPRPGVVIGGPVYAEPVFYGGWGLGFGSYGYRHYGGYGYRGGYGGGYHGYGGGRGWGGGGWGHHWR